MTATSNPRVSSILALAMTIGAAALGQVGCIDEPPVDEAGEDEAATTQDLSSTWVVPYISVQQPSGTIGPKVIDIREASQANGAKTQLWQRALGTNQKFTVMQVGTFNGNRSYWLTVAHS